MLHEKAHQLHAKLALIDEVAELLARCPFERGALEHLIARLQQIVDELALGGAFCSLSWQFDDDASVWRALRGSRVASRTRHALGSPPPSRAR